MVTNEERRKILDMVSEGKLSAGEAAELLSATAEKNTLGQTAMKTANGAEEAKSAQGTEAPESVATPSKTPTWLHVRVGDLKSGKNKVSVNIPLRMLKVGLKMGSVFTPSLGDIDWNEFTGALEAGEKGILVDVADEEDGEHVQIYVD